MGLGIAAIVRLCHPQSDSSWTALSFHIVGPIGGLGLYNLSQAAFFPTVKSFTCGWLDCRLLFRDCMSFDRIFLGDTDVSMGVGWRVLHECVVVS
jgi:hypothetical protein